MVRVFNTQELGTLRSLRTFTLRSVSSYLRGKVDRNQGDLKEVLVKLRVPEGLLEELSIFL